MGLTNALTEVPEGLNDERSRTRAGFYPDSCNTPPANLNLGPVSGERYQHLKTYLMSWSEIYSTTQYSASASWSIGSLIQKQQDGSW